MLRIVIQYEKKELLKSYLIFPAAIFCTLINIRDIEIYIGKYAICYITFVSSIYFHNIIEVMEALYAINAIFIFEVMCTLTIQLCNINCRRNKTQVMFEVYEARSFPIIFYLTPFMRRSKWNKEFFERRELTKCEAI